MQTAEAEVQKGERFEFGKNWQAFLGTLNDARIQVARRSITDALGTNDLRGKTFIDVGSGSGLFSLVARMLGARVHSFDFDPASVACARELRSRYFTDDPDWTIEQGSVLDHDFIASLGTFDIVYSWGVLHHTGDMWSALENVSTLVRPGGTLFIALYNDQGRKSRMWKRVKQIYCSGPAGKALINSTFIPWFTGRHVLRSMVQRKNLFAEYKKNRGMSVLHDWYDWLGGLPFEVAGVEPIFHFYQERGFDLRNIITANGGLGNNEFVFTKRAR